jgi:alkanesulfonate monooxygenase SsuD/methylene tetrahydromethanopterin reductase-like flavin-dependent oxidoreductase (luciferase family)
MGLHPFRFGVSLSPGSSRSDWQAKARQAEDLGYDIVQVPDHLGMSAPFDQLDLNLFIQLPWVVCARW